MFCQELKGIYSDPIVQMRRLRIKVKYLAHGHMDIKANHLNENTPSNSQTVNFLIVTTSSFPADFQQLFLLLFSMLFSFPALHLNRDIFRKKICLSAKINLSYFNSRQMI